MRQRSQHVEIFVHGVEDLRRKSGAEGVGREIAESRSPVNVLQYSQSRRRRSKTEKLFKEFVPSFFRFIDGQTVQKLLFHFVSYNNMFKIGKLVRFGTDKGIFYYIHLFIHFVGGEFFDGKPTCAEILFEFREMSFPKLSAAADNIVIKTALRFVQSHIFASERKSVVEIFVYVLFEKSMTALVDRGKDCA